MRLSRAGEITDPLTSEIFKDIEVIVLDSKRNSLLDEISYIWKFHQMPAEYSELFELENQFQTERKLIGTYTDIER